MTSNKRLPILTEQSVNTALATYMQSAGDFEREVLTAGRVSCHTGCSNCCYYPINVSILEGLAIYQRLSADRVWTSALKAQLQKHHDTVLGLAPEVWLLAMIPCPFLQDAQCQVYESRPFLCRTAYSRGDEYYCHPHRIGGELPSIVPRGDMIDNIRETEHKLLKKHHLRLMVFPLSTALLLAEKIAKGEVQLEDGYSSLLQETDA